MGTSGSGKTMLMKLLLKFCDPEQGEIKIGDYNLKHITQKIWRARCGVVMQEGYIFNDTITHNIAVGANYVDQKSSSKL